MLRESVVLNLKDPHALAAARALVDRSHVLLEGYRPGVLDRIGLGYSDVSRSNPRIVYCSITGFGQDGPYSEQIGHNINYEAVAGLLDPYISELGLDTYFHGGLPVGDVLSGCIAAVALVSYVRHAERTGQGKKLDLSITDSLAFAIAPNVTRSINGEDAWSEREAGYATYRTADGFIALGIAHEQEFWVSLCALLNLPELAELTHAERTTSKRELAPLIESRLIAHTTTEWLALLRGVVPCSPVNALDDLTEDPQLVHRGLFATAMDERGRQFKTLLSPLAQGAGVDERPMRVESLGESTARVLAELGLSEAEIEFLNAASG